MNLTENSNAYFIEGIKADFPVTLGFTKPHIEGVKIEDDIKRVFGKRNIYCTYLKQLHSSKIVFTDREGMHTGDGLITQKKKLILIIKTADCLPLFIIDNKKKQIGLIHIGWRGAKKGILNNLDVDFSSSYVIAGVGLRKCCYRISKDFLTVKPFYRFIIQKENTLYLDIISFIKNSLIEKGMPQENFFDIDICSNCSEYSFFSWRHNKTNKRTLSFIVKDG